MYICIIYDKVINYMFPKKIYTANVVCLIATVAYGIHPNIKPQIMKGVARKADAMKNNKSVVECCHAVKS